MGEITEAMQSLANDERLRMRLREAGFRDLHDNLATNYDEKRLESE